MTFAKIGRAGLKPIGPIAPNWAPHPILQTLVQVDWEPGLTEIVPNCTQHLPKSTLQTGAHINTCYINTACDL